MVFPDLRTGLRSLLCRGAAVVLGLFLLAQGSVLKAAPAAAASSAQLIYCGWFGNTIPTPAFVASHKAFLETQPFGGLCVYLRDDSTGLNVTTKVNTATPVSVASIATVLAPLRGQTFTALRENFGLVQGSTPPDFFDDWTVPVQNYANLARGLKDAGLRGIIFDNEQYSKQWGNYPTGAKYPNRTLAEYQAQARLRGRQAMAAMVAQFPDIAVLTLHGPTVSEPKVPQPLFPLWYMSNELQGPFFSGFMEGTGAGTFNVDGGELYHLRTADEFLRSYNWRKYTLPSDSINCAFIPPAMRPSWPGKSSIGFGVYDRPFGGAAMNTTVLRTTIANALRQADKYVWFYTEGPTFLLPSSQGGATAAWVDAVRLGRADAGIPTTPPPSPVPPPPPAPVPGSGPDAPSHLSAVAASASEVDLTWWDMSADETGFEIQRKTGAAGTWAKVLTATANVSAINDIGLAANTSYVYRARAINVAGASPYTAEVTVTTKTAAGPGPTAPKNLSIRSVARGRVSVTWWDMSANETGFEIERKTGSAGTWARIATKGANVSIHDDLTVSSGRLYYYRVRSVNATGASAFSNEISATAP